MSAAVQKVIEDLETQLNTELEQSDWYSKKLKEHEQKVIKLKEAVHELKFFQEAFNNKG